MYNIIRYGRCALIIFDRSDRRDISFRIRVNGTVFYFKTIRLASRARVVRHRRVVGNGSRTVGVKSFVPYEYAFRVMRSENVTTADTVYRVHCVRAVTVRVRPLRSDVAPSLVSSVAMRGVNEQKGNFPH